MDRILDRACRGLLGGIITWYAAHAVFWNAFGRNPLFATSAFGGLEMLLEAVWIGGLLGAAVGIVLWLIGRPDRRRRPANSKR